ncbi:MAG: hypothetical protein SGJ19_10275 [Planctomycetia bacterium]|nr:hypothetical protein [Planctomycetia bacterium]
MLFILASMVGITGIALIGSFVAFSTPPRHPSGNLEKSRRNLLRHRPTASLVD